MLFLEGSTGTCMHVEASEYCSLIFVMLLLVHGVGLWKVLILFALLHS